MATYKEFQDYFYKKYIENKNYKGVNIHGILFINYYFEYLYGISKIKEIIRFVLGIIFFKNKIKVMKSIKKNKYEFLILLNSDIKTVNKKSYILEKIITQMDKDKILLITFSKELFDKYLKKGYEIIYTQFPKFNTNLKMKEFVGFKYLGIISKYIKIIDFYDELLKNINIKVLMTTQDHEPLDYIFTQLAQKYKIKTITHQHGIFQEEAAYDYYYSDYILVWGEKSKEFLEKKGILKNKKCYITGTSKFNFLLKYRNLEKKDIVLCMTNDGSLFEKIELIKYFNNMDIDIGKKIIKLHPSEKIKLFLKKYPFLDKKIIVTKNYDVFKTAKYLITCRTTAILDGFFLKSSILDIVDRTPQIEYEVKLKDLENELLKRESNLDYFNKIIEVQEKELLKYVEYKNPEEKELKILKDII